MRKGLIFLSTAVLVTCLIALLVGHSPAQAAEDPTWTARYWNNKSLNGSPDVTRDEAEISHKWGTRRPAPGIDDETFSARWTRTVSFVKDKYVFRTTSDDGIRVWVDGTKIIDQWDDHPVQTYFVIRSMSAGEHDLKVEYYDNHGFANASFSWARLKDNPWSAQYFNGPDLGGGVALSRDENSIENYWGEASPASGISRENFSVRWTRTINFDKGSYLFKVNVTGGFRLYLDSAAIMSHWDIQSRTFRTTKNIAKGNHKIRLEYFSDGTPAVIFFHIYQQ